MLRIYLSQLWIYHSYSSVHFLIESNSTWNVETLHTGSILSSSVHPQCNQLLPATWTTSIRIEVSNLPPYQSNKTTAIEKKRNFGSDLWIVPFYASIASNLKCFVKHDVFYIQIGFKINFHSKKFNSHLMNIQFPLAKIYCHLISFQAVPNPFLYPMCTHSKTKQSMQLSIDKSMDCSCCQGVNLYGISTKEFLIQ